MIPLETDAESVACREDVLDVYEHPHDPKYLRLETHITSKTGSPVLSCRRRMPRRWPARSAPVFRGRSGPAERFWMNWHTFRDLPFRSRKWMKPLRGSSRDNQPRDVDEILRLGNCYSRELRPNIYSDRGSPDEPQELWFDDLHA